MTLCSVTRPITRRVPLHSHFKGSTSWGVSFLSTAAFVGRLPTDVLDRVPGGDVRKLLHRCLVKSPRERLRDMGDARIEIKDALITDTSTFPDEKQPERRTGSLVMMGLIAIVAVGVALWGFIRPSAPSPKAVIRSVIPLQKGDALALLQRTSSVAISPDGQHVAYVAVRGTSRQLYLRAMRKFEAIPIEGSNAARMPFFSPDSQWLGFYANNNLMKVSVSGGATLRVLSGMDEESRGATWGSDNTIVYAPTYLGGLSRISTEGGEPEVLTVPNAERRETTHRLPEVLPGGKTVLFSIGTSDIESYDDASVAALSLETGEYTVILKGGSNARYSATGHLLYVRAGALLAVPFDLANLRTTGTPVSVLHGVASDPIFGSSEFGISRDGSLIYTPENSRRYERRVLWVDREGRSELLIEAPRPFDSPRLSPNGRLLAVTIEGANNSLWVYDLERGTLTRLVSGFTNWIPVWTPDGLRVAFTSNREGTDNLFWQAVDGSDQPERLTESEYRQMPSSWSSDGKKLAFTEIHPDTGEDIWIVPIEADRQPELFLRTEFNES